MKRDSLKEVPQKEVELQRAMLKLVEKGRKQLFPTLMFWC